MTIALDLDIQSQLSVKACNYQSLDDIKRVLESIEDIEELYCAVSEFRGMNGYNFLYRGLSDSSYELLPTIVRNDVKNYSQEVSILEKAKLVCRKYGYDKYKLPTFNDNLFYMSICRHLGLDSRLIDWSASLWDSLSFLIKEDDFDKDGVLWIMAISKKDIQIEEIDPFIVDNKVHILKENYYIPNENSVTDQPLGIFRRYRQHGYFTVSPKDSIDIPFERITLPNGMELIRIIIPSTTKKMLLGYEKIVDVRNLMIDDNNSILKEIELLNQEYLRK